MLHYVVNLMRTKQIISTICYNNVEYLERKLKELIVSDKIDFWAFVKHIAENDETKDHIHLIVYPSKAIDTKELDDYLLEPQGVDKLPLGTCRLWHIVHEKNVNDYFLYVLHDLRYCRLKGYDKRKYTYTIEDFRTSSKEALEDNINTAYHRSEFSYNNTLRHMAIDTNVSAYDIVKNGYVDIKNMCGFHHMCQIIGK